jgi:hypothetical protein
MTLGKQNSHDLGAITAASSFQFSWRSSTGRLCSCGMDLLKALVGLSKRQGKTVHKDFIMEEGAYLRVSE